MYILEKNICGKNLQQFVSSWLMWGKGHANIPKFFLKFCGLNWSQSGSHEILPLDMFFYWNYRPLLFGIYLKKVGRSAYALLPKKLITLLLWILIRVEIAWFKIFSFPCGTLSGDEYKSGSTNLLHSSILSLSISSFLAFQVSLSAFSA